MDRNFWFWIIWLAAGGFLQAQREVASDGYWQQRVRYVMKADVDVKNHRYHGRQEIVYKNNSPDTLREIWVHLYWNAFRPGSELYWHNHGLPDPDPRIEKLKNYKADESGKYVFHSVKQDGEGVSYAIFETLMRIDLKRALLPGDSTVISTDYDCQIPKLNRRSGRDNAEGIDFSMAQWYPKIAEYDRRGWHADPFLGREFYGVWGDFDVEIRIDSAYVVGGTGYLQNPDEKPVDGKRVWHFVAPEVHDFSWAADPDYVHETYPGPDGVTLHFYYVPSSEKVKKNWGNLKEYTAKAMAFYNEIIGMYPYKQYSVIQAGDGGMEYGMCTFITGKRSFPSLAGVTFHELAHSWFQFVLATDETRYPWMDEGFTTYISTIAMNEVGSGKHEQNPMWRTVSSYLNYAGSKYEEPVAIWSDLYGSNEAYWTNAYDKGALFLWQLSNVAGIEATFKFLQDYYRKWKFRHPQPADMMRVAEQSTGMELDWLYNQWIESTHHVDYAVEKVEKTDGNRTRITIRRKGSMPVPVDVAVLTDKGVVTYHVPYFRTLRYRETNNLEGEFRLVKPWNDGKDVYILTADIPYRLIRKVVIDPLVMTCDIQYKDNVWEVKKKR